MEDIQEVAPEVQEPVKPYVKAIHENLIQAFGKDNVPDESYFTNKISSDASYAKGVHENLIQAFGKDNVPDFEYFSNQLKKKDGGTPLTSSDTPLPSIVQPTKVSKPSGYTLADGTQMSNVAPPQPQQQDNSGFDVNKSVDKINSLKQKLDVYNNIVSQSSFNDDDKRELRRLNGELGANLGSLATRGQNSLDQEGYNNSIKNYNATSDKINALLSKKGGMTDDQIADYKNTVDQLNGEVVKINQFDKDNQTSKMNPITHQRVSADDEIRQMLAHSSETGVHEANSFNDLQENKDFGQFKNSVRGQQYIIDQSGLSPDDKEKAKSLLAKSKSLFINSLDPELARDYNNPHNPLKGIVDPDQYAGLETLRMFDPVKYDNAIRDITTTITPKYEHSTSFDFDKYELTPYEKESEETISQKIQKENTLKNLGEIGRQNKQAYVAEHMHDLNNDILNTDNPEEKAKIQTQLSQYQSTLNAIDQSKKNDADKYPLTTQLDLDNQVKDLIHDSGVNPAEMFMSKIATGIISSGKSIENLVTGMFGSDEQNRKLQMQRGGEAIQNQSNDYVIEENRRKASPVIPVFNKELIAERDKILKDPYLSDAERKQKLSTAVFNNQDKIDYITNPNKGKTANIWSMATVYSNVGMIGDIASIALQSLGTEGVGATKLISATVPMFLNAQNSFYEQAIAEGRRDPQSYANLHALIMAAAGLINPDLDIVKRAVGMKTVTGKIIAGLDEATWDAVLSKNKPLLDKIIGGTKSALGETAKMGLVYGAGTSLASNISDKAFFNKKISASEIAEEALDETKNTIVNSIALIGFHGIMNGKAVNEVSPDQKAVIWTLGHNEEIGKILVDEAFKRGDITKAEADKRKEIISKIASLIEKVPEQNKKGEPQTDRQKVDYLYNLLIKDKIGELKKSLPDSEKESLNEKALQVDSENSKIFNTTVKVNKIPDVKVPTEKVEIPTDLEERGEQIESTLEAERRRSNGERIFAVSEQDGTPIEVTSIEMLRNYTPDQLIAYKPAEQHLPEHQEIGKAILSHVGINTSPEATRVYDATNLDTIDAEGYDDTQKKVLGDVSNVVKSISKLVDQSTGQKLTVTVHASPKSYAEAVARSGGDIQSARSKGFYLGTNGEIHLNMAKVTPETLLHEGFHPILDYMAKHNPEIIDTLHSQLAGLKGGQDIIDIAKEKYNGDITQKKEAITDYIAKVANGDIVLDRTSFQKVKDWIINTLKELGIPIDKSIESIKDIQDLAKTISEKFAKGEEIKIAAKKYAETAISDIPSEGVDIDSTIDTKTDRGPQFSKEKEKEGWLKDVHIVDVDKLKGSKVSRVVFYDNTRVGKFDVKNRITGYKPDIDGKGGFGYSFIPEMVANKMVLAFTSINQAIQTIKRHAQNPDSLLGVAMQKQSTAHLGNLDTNELLFGLNGKGIFQNAAKTIDTKGLKGAEKAAKIKENENQILDTIKKSIIELSTKKSKESENVKKVIGNLDKIKTLDQFQTEFLLKDANSFGIRGTILKDLLQDYPTKITKGTRGSHELLHYKFGIPTLSELADGINDKHFENAQLGDVVKYIKPYDDPIIFITNKDMFDKLSKNPTPEMKANNIKLELLPEELSHISYPVVIKGENVGIGNKYVSAVDLFPKFKEEGVTKSGSFFKVGRMKADAEMGEIPENAEAQGVAQYSKENAGDKKLQSAIDAQREAGISEEGIRKGLESVKEDLGITDEDIDRLMTPKEEPIKEEIPIAKKWSGTLISKAGLQASDYPFSKDFDVRGGQEVATDMLSRIKSQATRNDISLASQLRRKVESMKGTNPHPTEYNIISAGTHLLNIDKQIETAIENGQNIDNLRQERDETAAVLRKLGNNAGRNLGLFNLIFHEANSSEIKVTVNSIKRTLNIKNIAESVAELDSQLKRGEINPIDYEKVKPYVEKIEKYKADLDVAEKTFEDRAKEFRKESEEAALKEAFEKGREDVLNSRRPVLERKGNKDLANRLRGLKINKGGEEAPKLDTGTAQFSKDVTTPKEEIWAKRIDDIAAIVEGEKSIKEAISQLISEGKLKESDRVGIEQMIYKNILAEDATEKLKGFATAGETIITDAMVKEGVIKDIVEGVLHSGTSYDKVLDEATKLLQEQLPNVTRGMVSDAYIRKGEFKQETKGNLNKDIVAKRQALRRLDAKEARISALEDAAKFHTAANKNEKKKLLSEKEKEYDDKINKLNKDKKDAEKFYGESDATHRRINALEDELENLKNNIRKTVDPAKVKSLSDREIEVKKKISEEKKRLNTAEKEAGTFYGESNAKSERIQSLRDEIEDLEKGIRKKAKTLNKTEYTGEEKDLVEKRDKLRRDLAKEERAANRFYKESESGNIHLEKMAQELDRLINREEKEDDPVKHKEISERRRNLQQKITAERLAWDKEKKLKSIEDEMHSVQSSKQVYRRAIKDKKETSNALNAAKEELEKAYAEAGIRRETKELQPIKIEQEYQAEVDKINNDNSLSDDEKKARLEDVKDARDTQLSGTKQGVLSLLSDALGDMRDSSIEKANDSLKDNDNDSFKYHNKVAMMLTDMKSSLDPNGENIIDMTNKAYGDIEKLLKDKSLSEEDRAALEKIKRDFENNSMLTANALTEKRLKAQWEAEIRSNERKINSGNFTEMPENEYDFRTNDELIRLNAERMKFSGKLKALANEAKEKNKNLVDQSLDISSKLLVSGAHTLAKVTEAGSFKPIMDSIVELSMGNFVGKYITQTTGTTLRGAGEGVRALAAYRTRESALSHIEVLKNKRSEELKKYAKAINDNLSESEIAKAKKQFDKADLSYAISTMYRSIDANSLKTFKDYIFHSSTEYDEMMGKGSKKSLSDYNTKLQKTGYILDGWIRMHGAMKTSLSARQAMMRSFSSTLAEFQKEGRPLNEDNISLAMIIAHDAYEEGRLTNKTDVSKLVTGWKNSENKIGRAVANAVFPVSTIAFNVAKRGFDYSSVGIEGWSRLAIEAKKGMRLNEAEGREYDNWFKAVKAGISRIPLQERKYINSVISRGLFGAAIGAITLYGLANGKIKYGGTFDDQRKRKITGTDGEPLEPNQWEFFGHRMGAVSNAFLNHLPEFMPMALAANHYQIGELGGSSNDKFSADLQEIEARLPFQTVLALANTTKWGKTLTDRFAKFSLGSEIGEMTDKYSDQRDKSNILNRMRANIGLGRFNVTKDQQKQIDEEEKYVREEKATLKTQKEIDDLMKESNEVIKGILAQPIEENNNPKK